MLNIQERTKKKILIFDGAMGTMLQQRGLIPGELPELLNLSHPNKITEIHREYVRAGADIITTNTFQANELKLGSEHSVEDVITAAVRCARAAVCCTDHPDEGCDDHSTDHRTWESTDRYVALDVGPLGQLMEPMGTVTFQQAYDIFRRQMLAGAAAGADLILIETISDLYEAKAAILAAKENTSLPVICSLTFQENGRTFVGCDALTAVVTLQDLGVDALGVNCSVGPESLQDIVATLLTYSRLPVIMQANAGMPIVRGTDTVYGLTPKSYAEQVMTMVHQGVRIVGGCCGTTPEYISKLREQIGGMSPIQTQPRPVSTCTSGTQTVVLDGITTAIGERLNPTGKKKMQQALRDNDTTYLVNEALTQVQAGAQILDVNVGLPEIDEPATLVRTIQYVQAVTNVPLQIDSADPAAIAAAIRVYNGKPIINSVSGKKESMKQIFPLVKKYGALVIGLTLDEKGIPPTARERLEIARRLRDTAFAYGIPQENLLIDCLVLTASAQQSQVKETLAAIRLIKAELNLKTVLGISNVSFGLPGRDLINATFLAAALGAGLDAAILNPLSPRYREVLDTYRVLNDEDKDSICYIGKYAHQTANPSTPALAGPEAATLETTTAAAVPSAISPSFVSPSATSQSSISPSAISPLGAAPVATELSLATIIEQGRRDESKAKVKDLLKHMPPLTIIDQEFIPALNRVGQRFETGEIFLPQLLMSAQAVQNGFAVISDQMQATGEKQQTKGKILLATVHGDIHDIGKNIVGMLLQNYGYDIVDLGKDVPAAAVVDAARTQGIRLIGLSALMTTTLKSMKETIATVRDAGLSCTFFVGGAVLNEEYANFVGADYYAKDAMEGVVFANRFFQGFSE